MQLSVAYTSSPGLALVTPAELSSNKIGNGRRAVPPISTNAWGTLSIPDKFKKTLITPFVNRAQTAYY